VEVTQIPLHHVLLRKMHRNKITSQWLGVWWSALEISRTTTLAKQLSCLGSVFWGDLGLVVWGKRIPNLLGPPNVGYVSTIWVVIGILVGGTMGYICKTS
jgi:hypothetical protein